MFRLYCIVSLFAFLGLSTAGSRINMFKTVLKTVESPEINGKYFDEDETVLELNRNKTVDGVITITIDLPKDVMVKMVVYESAGNNRFQHLLTNDWKPLCHYANTKQFFYNIFHKYCGFPESCPITKNQYKCQNANLDPNEAPKDLLKMGKGKEWKVTMELKLKKEIIAVWTFKVDIY